MFVFSLASHFPWEGVSEREREGGGRERERERERGGGGGEREIGADILQKSSYLSFFSNPVLNALCFLLSTNISLCAAFR